MSAKRGVRCLYGLYIASVLTVGVSAAQAQNQAVPLTLGIVAQYKSDKTFSSIVIGDPKVVEVNATSDRTLTLLPLANGLTNVLLLNGKGETINNITIWVSDAGPSRVRIFRRPLTNYAVYRCGVIGCELIDQALSKEPPSPSAPSTPIGETIQGSDEWRPVARQGR
jgi:hypothetical protein